MRFASQNEPTKELGPNDNRDLTNSKIVSLYNNHQALQPFNRWTSAFGYFKEIKSERIFLFECHKERVKDFRFNDRLRVDQRYRRDTLH